MKVEIQHLNGLIEFREPVLIAVAYFSFRDPDHWQLLPLWVTAREDGNPEAGNMTLEIQPPLGQWPVYKEVAAVSAGPLAPAP